ncbi:hypothetical protein JOQ06_025852, partial [Pogonophryne albipinna]
MSLMALRWHTASPAGSGPGANCPSRLAACSNMPMETCEGSAHDRCNTRGHQLPNLHSRLSDGATEARIDGEVSGCQEPARPHWHRIKAGTNAAHRQSGKPEHTQAQEHPQTWPHSSRLYHRGVI